MKSFVDKKSLFLIASVFVVLMLVFSLGFVNAELDVKKIEKVSYEQPPSSNNYGNWILDGNNLFPEIVGNYVGIGTSNPLTQLHVEGDYFVLGGNGDVSGDGVLTSMDALFSNYIVNVANFKYSEGDFDAGNYGRADLGGTGLVTHLDTELIPKVITGLMSMEEARDLKWKLQGRAVSISNDASVGYEEYFDSGTKLHLGLNNVNGDWENHLTIDWDGNAEIDKDLNVGGKIFSEYHCFTEDCSVYLRYNGTCIVSSNDAEASCI